MLANDSPCIDWGIDMKDMMQQQKDAVDSGYWPLYRYDPRLKEQGLQPLNSAYSLKALYTEEHLSIADLFDLCFEKFSKGVFPFFVG